MLKLPDNLSISPGLAPVGRVIPVLAVDNVGTALQELNAKATQFVIGREYAAQVLSKVDGSAYLVKIDNTVLKMELGATAQAGQSVNLRYIKDTPAPTFLFTPPVSFASEDALEISQGARLIGQYLQEAEKHGVSSKYEATAIVTNAPKEPHMVAHGLKQAISNSGLFYESHLNEMLQGGRAVAAVMQEPQNQAQSLTQIATLTSQQLAVLEHSRISWHGEVWPGQKMDWEVYVEPHDEDRGERAQVQKEDVRPVISEVKLDFPNLGVVAAKLSIINGYVSINLRAEQEATIDELRSKGFVLSRAINNTGLKLDSLTVSAYE